MARPLCWRLVVYLATSLLLQQRGWAQSARPEEVKFPSGNLVLHGFIYKPFGNGPFPAILYNHGSERNPGQKPELARLFSNRGYVFFVPHRRSHGRYPMTLLWIHSMPNGREESSRCKRHTSKISWQPSPTLKNCLT